MADIVEKISFEFDNTGINVASNAIEGLVQKLDDLEKKATTAMGAVDDAIKADEIFTILMGEDVDPRREWIETNAKYVVNLDI